MLSSIWTKFEYIFCEVIAGVAPTGDRRHRKACARCTPSCDALPRGAATMGGTPLHEGELLSGPRLNAT